MFTNILALLLALIPGSYEAKATYFPHDCAITIGSRCFTRSEFNNLTMLRGDTTSSGQCTTLRGPNDTAGYSATGATGFRVDAVRCKAQGTAIKCRIGYIDADEGFASGTCTGIHYPSSNGASEYGGSASVVDAPIDGNNNGNGMWGEMAWPPGKGFLIPNGKFPVMLSGAGAAVFAEVWGHEE
jgi:hypothetical protein